jgi:hypothetical protein
MSEQQNGPQAGTFGGITYGEGVQANTMCGAPRPGYPLLCSFGPDHGDGHSWELTEAEREKYVSESRRVLEAYLARIGLSRPADAAMQVQVTLLRQWTEHLDDVLEAESLPADVRARIIRAVIYGGAPSLAEAEIRQEMTAEMTDVLSRSTAPRMPWPGT